jgi:hypothetical protein
MGEPATLSPARPERLRWLTPPPTLRAPFEAVQGRLERLAAAGAARAVYTAHRRGVYRASDAELGAVAIKELRNPSLARQLWFGWLAEHPGAREYRVGVGFEARGGRTLAHLGAALERTAVGLLRVLVFTRWLEGAVTLTRWLADRPGPPSPALLASVAAQVVAAARLGLVHHRHSSNNLLVVSPDGDPLLHTIDFSHATLDEGLEPGGLAGDVARIARWILHERLWSRAAVQAFFESVAAEARPEVPDPAAFVQRMDRELEAVLRDPSARDPSTD